jgi:hypothetical protein
MEGERRRNFGGERWVDRQTDRRVTIEGRKFGEKRHKG